MDIGRPPVDLLGSTGSTCRPRPASPKRLRGDAQHPSAVNASEVGPTLLVRHDASDARSRRIIRHRGSREATQGAAPAQELRSAINLTNLYWLLGSIWFSWFPRFAPFNLSNSWIISKPLEAPSCPVAGAFNNCTTNVGTCCPNSQPTAAGKLINGELSSHPILNPFDQT